MFNVIVAGCGGISGRWLDYSTRRDDVYIVALVDPVLENAYAHKKNYRLDCPVFSTLDQAIKEVNANLLFDLTPPEMHETVVTTGLRNGLDVFGEKPMAHNMQAAHRIIETADKTGKHYFVMQNRRYLHGIRTLKKVIHSGSIGRPYHVSVDMFLGAHFTGFRNEMEHPLILDMAIHIFDEARYLLNEARAVSAYCQEYNPPHSWYKGAAGADCIFEMSDGSILSFRGSWASRSENTSSHGKWVVSCTEGAGVWDGYSGVWINEAQPVPPGMSYYEEEGLRRQIPLDRQGQEEHDGCLDDMFNSLKNGIPMQTDCHNNIHSLAMVHACIESSKTGRKIYI
ncbi:MAG: Gfo/Idh/MocA family oxidoreductase [Clostridiales bacterium]|nr:Gfo/Idh/MocA family oxidoreductase [Clostridiales bacterium]